MSTHARLSASSAHRWMACPGSVKLSAGLESRSSAAAAEGTAAHFVAADALVGYYGVEMGLGAPLNVDGFIVTVTQEMVDGVQLYLDHLKSTHKKGDVDFVEVDLTAALQTLDPDLGGTADHVRWRPKAHHLFVTDFKYGAGHLVQPEGNPQLKIYALGALLDLTRRSAGNPRQVTVTIVQPRIEHEDGRIRSWTFKASELIDFAADVAESASRTRDSNAPLVPGEGQCKWCPAKHRCTELEKRQQALVAAEFSDVVPYEPAALSRALDAIPLVEARIKALREFAYAEAERGNAPPGYKLVAKRATRKWKSEEAVRSWAQAKAIDAFEAPTFKSPAQLEKGLSKEEKAELAHYVESVSSGHTLVPESDKRQAVHKALAEEFAVVPGTAE